MKNLCRPLPPAAALIFRRQCPISVQQLRLTASQRYVSATNEYVVNTRAEIKRVASPDHHICHLADLQRTISIRDTENLRRRQRHSPQRLLPRHPTGDRVARLLPEIARVLRRRLHQRDLRATFREQ